jgi:steroid delta-isomerase-like uncharacterized protein
MSRTPAENKLLARRYFEQILNDGNFSVADTLLASDLYSAIRRSLRAASTSSKRQSVACAPHFLTCASRFHDEIAEADNVVLRWSVTGTQRGEFFGHPASGRTIEVSGINIFRIVHGKIQEIWVNMDRLGEAEQLGWIEPSRV